MDRPSHFFPVFQSTILSSEPSSFASAHFSQYAACTWPPCSWQLSLELCWVSQARLCTPRNFCWPEAAGWKTRSGPMSVQFVQSFSRSFLAIYPEMCVRTLSSASLYMGSLVRSAMGLHISHNCSVLSSCYLFSSLGNRKKDLSGHFRREFVQLSAPQKSPVPLRDMFGNLAEFGRTPSLAESRCSLASGRCPLIGENARKLGQCGILP